MTAPPSVRVATGTAPVLEVFASVQGEGLFVGEPQVFVRFAGCPLRCRYCDTPSSWERPAPDAARARVRVAAGGRGAVREERGAPHPARLLGWIDELDPERRRAVSLTGGEPLLAADTLRELSRLLEPRPVHLETSGIPVEALRSLESRFAHVSLDLKVAADLDEPVGPGELPRTAVEWRAARRAGLELLSGRGATGTRTAAAKLVVTGGHLRAEFDPILDDLADLAPEIPLIVQPVTPRAGVARPSRALLLELVEAALERGLSPRLLPQVHPILGLA